MVEPAPEPRRLPIARLAALLALCLCATALPAVGFEEAWDRALSESNEPAPESVSGNPAAPALPKPWGLWADRAPYPYYDGPFSMDVADDLVARDILFDFQHEIWLAPGDTRGAWARMRARFGLFLADVEYLQTAKHTTAGYLGSREITDWSDITWARGHLGVNWPIPDIGYVEAAVGASGFDRTHGLSRIGVDVRAGAMLYPLWPLGLEVYASRTFHFDGTGVNEFGARLHVQAFRHLFVTAGWRWLNVDGSGYGSQGFTLGISFTFGNLRTFFWSPMRGPAW